MMLKDIVADFQDMSIAKIANAVNPEDSSGLYAVMIKTAESEVGKFPIGTKTETEQSVFAINNNPNIPDAIKAPAKYYVKNAALHFNVEGAEEWSTEKSSRLIKEAACYPKEDTIEYSLLIKGNTFPMETSHEVKIAEDFFLANIKDIDPYDRNLMSKAIVKSASVTGVTPAQTVKNYATPILGSMAKRELAIRKHAMSDNKQYIEVLDKLASKLSDIDALTFISTLEMADKAAGFNANRTHYDPSSYFENEVFDISVDLDRLSKIASISEDKSTGDFLNKIL